MAGNDMSSEVRTRTVLWCVPRSGSTALTKCLSFIDGLEAWFEPYAYCRAINERAELLNFTLPPTIEGNGEAYHQAADVFDQIGQCKSDSKHLSISSTKRRLESSDSTHVFSKDMAFAISKKYDFIPDGFRHTFLIRHPIRVFSSFRKAIFQNMSANGLLSGEAADEKKFDIGRDYHNMDLEGLLFKDLYDLWKRTGEKTGSTPIVIDGDDLLSNPAEMLPKYCRAVGLPYSESLLKWDASTKRVYDWIYPAGDRTKSMSELYKRAVKSSEFMPPSPMPDRSNVTPDVIRCADQMMPYYNEMYEARMKI